MSVLNKIPITLKIYYTHSKHGGQWPLCRVLWDNKQVANFEANGQEMEFTVVPKSEGRSTLIVEHYGKNAYTEHDKYIEVVGIRVNNIDLKHIIWESTQYPITAPWDEPFQEDGNLYLGHNGHIIWSFDNPLLLDIQKRLGVRKGTQEGQESTRKVLNEIREYFANEKDH